MDNILISHFRIENDQKRNKEILSCITTNLQLNFFQEVRLIIEGDIPLDFSEELYKVKTNSKVVIESTTKRLTYKDIFKICNLDPKKTFYLTNADIAFNESVRKIDTLTTCMDQGVVFAQHRYNLIPGTEEIVFEKTPPITGQNYSGSADVFIFQTPIEFSHEFNFFPGTSYCDQHISSLLSKSGRLCVAIKDIVCEHRHSSKINKLGRVQDEDYKCQKNNNCKENLNNLDIKYNPILKSEEMLLIFHAYHAIEDPGLKNLEFLCQTYLKHKHGLPNEIQKDPAKEMTSEISKILESKIDPLEFAKTIKPEPAFNWQGFPNPIFLLKSIFDNEQ